MQPVIVLGAGLAGLSAALTLARTTRQVILVSAQSSERSQSVLAEGGMNAVLDLMGEHDTVEEHFQDTMAGGVWLADPNAVRGLVSEAPEIARDLLSLGAAFQREGGRMIQRNFGGQRKKRTCYAKSSTGKVLVSTLVDAVRCYEARGLITRLPHHTLSQFLIEGDACGGCIVADVYTGDETLLKGPVICCAGGMGGLFGGLTTGTTTNTGDVAACALAQGVRLSNLEFLQYHPTTVAISGKRLLVSEAARGEGGRLYVMRDGKPYYFMEDRYPELGNLMPRDVVSREEYRVVCDPALADQVYLDLTGLSRTVWSRRLSDLHEEVKHYLGIDARRHPIPVEPGIHYCMGGIHVDERHHTNVRGLLAAGECASIYHGANRLGGNSLLGAIRGGRVAARTVMEEGEVAPDVRWVRLTPEAPDVACELAMRKALASSLGIIRDRRGLEAGLATLDGLPATRRTALARAVVRAALAREESRGAHQRSDYPKTLDAFQKTTTVSLEGTVICVRFEDIPKLRDEVSAT